MNLPSKTQTNHSWKNKKNISQKNRTDRLDLRRNKKSSWHEIISWRYWKKKISWKGILITCTILAVGGFVAAYGLIWWVSRDLPSPDKFIIRHVAESTKIYDRTGQTVLYEISGDVKRTRINNLSDIPDAVKQATISIEDKDFYKHGGISYWAIFRTAVKNLIFGTTYGGSTLTQQFVKNAVLTTEKKYIRKLKEAIMAVQMEKVYSKDQILLMYFNEIPYGSTAYGVEAAAEMYFGKNIKQINLPEAAILAAIPQAPTFYSPYGSHKDALLKRQQYVLDMMVKYGYISEDEAKVAKGVKLTFREPSNNITAPHFVMYVKELMVNKYGESAVEQDGMKIYTTLDLYKQKAAEETLTKYGETNAEKYQASNGALVSIDPKTGQILAMVGSRDYFNDDIDGQVNIATSLRQPGSSLKPLVYATAFSKGYSPETVLYDVLTNFSADPAKPYEPHNYNGKDNGPVSIRQALAGSLNIPAVKALYLAGIDNVLENAHELGYTSFSDKDRYGLSLVLGGGEVKMLEHVNAYSAFAREGKISPVTAILKVEDKNGKTLEEYKPAAEKKVFESDIAREINDILSDNDARAFVFGAKNLLTLGSRPVAVKTGTTNDYRDAWTIGYTPSIVTGVWVGNNDFSPMKKGSAAATIAVPIWHDYMSKILGDTPIESFKKYEPTKTGKNMLDGVDVGETKARIDRASGLLATEFTPPNFIEEKAYKQAHCILYFVDKDDPLGDAPKNPADDPQFALWESRVQEWAAKQGYSSSTPPAEYDNLHIPGNIPSMSVITPSSNQTITEPLLIARIEASAPRGINRAEYYVDDNLLSISSSYPYNLEKNIGFLANGFHSLLVRVCDDIDNCSEEKLDFNLSAKNRQVNDSFSISWLGPASDSKFTTKDFPMNIRLRLQNPENIGKIVAYYVSSDGKEIIAANASMLTGEEATLAWSIAPAPGDYNAYANAYGWSGQTISTDKVKITVAADKATSTTQTR